MKKEASKKSKLWLWLLIGAVALLAVAGVVVALVLGSGGKDEGPKGGRPELYWNIDKVAYTENSESGLSTREPGEDGNFHVRFAINGEIQEKIVTDKRLINYIDTMDVMGLILDEEGAVVDVVNPKDIAKELTKNAYVKTATDKLITANSSVAMNGMNIKIELNELTEIYDVTPEAENPGQRIQFSDLKAMDTLTVYANDLEQNTHVYLTSHSKQSKVYWRANQSYNSTEKATSRVPDENGAYTIPFFCDGERVELKTKDKTIATKIDSVSRWKCHFGFTFDEEGYIIEQFVSALGIQGVIVADCWDIVDIQEDTYTIQRLVTNDGSVWTGTISSDAVIYDASYAAMSEKRQGKQIDSLQLGDRVTVWTDTSGKVVLVYVSNRIVDVPACWVPTRKYSSTLKETTREVGPSGYYEVDLVPEGGPKQTYYIKDKETMSYLDSITQKCVGIKADANRVIECVYHFEALTGYTCATQGGCVTSITGSIFSKISIGKPDTTVNLVLAPNARVYNVSAYGEMGAPTTIQPNDHVYGYRQPTGEILVAFVTKRAIGGDHLYWHLDKMYDSTKKVSTREPDADGWYHLLFAYKGKQITLKTRSLEIVESIDKLSIGATALDVSGDVILKVYDATYAYGGQKVASGYRYRSMTDAGLYHTVYNTDATKTVDFKMAEDCVIYNVSPVFDSHQGERIYSIPYNAMLTVFCDIYGEAKVVYVRAQDVDDMYWKTEYLYDSSKKVTKRVPDANGYYWYDLAVNGECKRFKTKDQKIANSMDSYAGGFGLNVKGDEILAFVSSSSVKNVKGNGVNGYCITEINGNKITLTYNKPTSSFGKTETFTINSKTKIFDVSPSAKNFGEYTELKVGDTVRSYQSRDDATHSYVYVMARSTRAGGEYGYCEVCKKDVTWNPIMNCASITAADGHWYVTDNMTSWVQQSFANKTKDFTICLDLNGRTLTRSENGRMFRVAEGETMNIMDSVGGGKVVSGGGKNYSGGLLLMSAGGKVNMYGGTLEVVNSQYQSGNGGNINMGGKGTSFTLYNGTITGGRSYARSTSAPGAGGNVYISSGAEFTMYGGTVSNGTAYGAFVTDEDTGVTKAAAAYGGNFYLSSGSIINILGGTVTGGEVVRETQTSGGKTLTVSAYGGNFYLSSSSGVLNVQNATISDGVATRGGNICGLGNNTFENAVISGGTVRERGGNIYSTNGTWTYDGNTQIIDGHAGIRIENGGEVVESYNGCGGNIASHGGIHDLKKVTVDNGVVVGTSGGANIYQYRNKAENIISIYDGALIQNGSTKGSGGNIYQAGYYTAPNADGKYVIQFDDNGDPYLGTLNVYGGQILNGTCDNEAAGTAYGGNIYAKGHLNIAGGVISGGKQGENPYDINYAAETYKNEAGETLMFADLTISGGTVADQFAITRARKLTISGAPKMGKLDFKSNVAELGELTEGAQMAVISIPGVFTTPCEKAQEYVDAGYFTSYKPGKILGVTENNELCLFDPADLVDPATVNPAAKAMDFSDADPETGVVVAKCPACDVEVEWYPLEANQTGKSLVLTNSHYYLSEAVDYTANNYLYSVTSEQRVCVNLNGQNITSTERVFYSEKSATTLSIMGEGVVTGAPSTKSTSNNGVLDLTTNANIYGGTYISKNVSPAIGNRKTSSGSAIVNIYEEAVVLNETANGKALYVRGNGGLNICGGTIEGIVYDEASNGGIAVSGTVVIDDLVLEAGSLMTVGELADDSKINVTAAGVFTNPFEKAEEYLNAGIFTSPIPLSVTVNNELMAELPIKWCDHCNQEVQWTPWSNGHKDGQNVHYYIPEGGFTQDQQYTIVEESDIILDLNGQTLTGAPSKRLFLIYGTLTVVDSVGGGKIETKVNPDGAGGVALVSKKTSTQEIGGETVTTTYIGTLNLYGGTLTVAADHATNKNGGILSVSGGATLNMYGGTIEGGTATVNGKNIYTSGATLNIAGGYVDGGIYASADTSVFLSGNAKIAKTEDGLYLAEGNLINLGALDAEAEIYVSGIAGAITGVLANADEYLDNIKPAINHWAVENIDGVLTLVDYNVPFDPNAVAAQAAAMDFSNPDADGVVEAECPVCREDVKWMRLSANTGTKSMVLESGHYYLSDSIDYTHNTALYSITKQNHVCVNLNGQDLKATQRAFYTENVGTVLNVMGEGTVTGAGYESGSKWYGVFDLTTDANFYGGTYISTAAGPAIGNRKTSSGDGLVSIYAGTTVTNETADGLALYVLTNGSMAINGGTVNGRVLNSNSKGLTVSGAPVINKLDLTNGAKLTVGELTTGADITVDAEGVFTEDLADAAAVVGYFKATEGRVVEVEGAALAVGAAAPVKSIYEQAKEMVFTTSEPDGKVTAVCPVCKTEADWYPLPAVTDTTASETKRSISLKDGAHHHYYLDTAVDYTQNTGYYAVSAKTKMCLNLNGQTMVSASRAFWNETADTVVNIMGDGSISGHGYWINEAAGTYRAVFDGTAAFNLYGGTYGSENIFPVFQMRSSSNPKCVLSIYEGTTIQTSTAACALEVLNNSSIHIYGGSVLGGSIKKSSSTAGLTISGNPVIELLDLTNGNTAGIGKLTEGASICVDANGVFTSEVADISAAMGYFSAPAGKKIAVEAGNLAVVEDVVLECPHCGLTEAELEAAGTPWAPWTAAYGKDTKGTITTGHYYMTEDVTGMNGYYYIGTSTDDDINNLSVDVVLDMRGFDLQSSTRVFYGYTNNHLTLWDSVGGSTVQGGLATSAGGTIFFGDGGTGASLSLYGITVKDGATANRDKNGAVLFMSGENQLHIENCEIVGGTAQSGGAICMGNSGAVIKDSTIKGGNVSQKGAAVYMSSTGSLTLENSTIISGTAATANGVYIPKGGTLTVNGGNAEDIFVNEASASVTLSGAAVIGKLDLTCGAKANVEGLTSGAAIAVAADGVFTQDLTDAAAFKGYFSPSASGMIVSVDGAALAITEDTTVSTEPTEPAAPTEPDGEPVGTDIYELAKAMDFTAGGVVTAVCPVCGVEHNWNPLPDATGSSSNPLAPGAYYVAADMVQTKLYYTKSGTTCINLNGKSITNETSRVFYIEGASTVMNFMGDGAVAGKGGYNSANFNAYGGAVDACAETNFYGGTWSSTNEHPSLVCRGSRASCVMSIYAGTKIERTATGVQGANLYVSDYGTVNMYAGEIVGGTAIVIPVVHETEKYGGNVFVKAISKDAAYTSSFNLYGGTISGGQADHKGGNIAVVGSASTTGATQANIYGGNIEGGSVFATGDNASLTLSTKAVVDYLDAVGSVLYTVDALESGASIKVVAEENVAFTNPNAEAYAAYFSTDVEGKSIIADSNGALMIGVPASGGDEGGEQTGPRTTCPHCDVALSEITWTDITVLDAKYTVTASGHYRLTGDMNVTSGNAITMADATSTTGLDIVLDTCGFDINCPGGRCFYVAKYNKFTVFDSVGGTVATSTSTNNALGGSGLVAYAGAEANIYDITLNGSAGANGKGNCISVYATSTVVNIYSGTFSGTDCTTAGNPGGTVYNHGTLNIYGGTFNDAEVIDAFGGCLYSDGTLNIANATLLGDVYIASGSVSLSGATVIAELQLASGVLAELDLSDGADITVDADGVFSVANTNAQSYKDNGYVKAVAGKEISVTDGVMSMAAASVFRRVLNLFGII